MHGPLVGILIGTPPSIKSRAQSAIGISENITAAIPARFKKVTVRGVVKSKKLLPQNSSLSFPHTFLKQSFMQVSVLVLQIVSGICSIFTDSSAAASTQEQPLQTSGKLSTRSYSSFYYAQHVFKPGCFSSKAILFC